MKTIYKAAALAVLAMPASIAIVAPAAAQAVSGVAVLDVEKAIVNSNAFIGAMKLIETTYKPNIDQANAKAAEINAKLKPMQDAYAAARKVPNANAATLATQQAAIQKVAQEGQQQVDQLRQPFEFANAYVGEEIFKKLEPARDKVMAARKITIALVPQATIKFADSVDITKAVTDQLNADFPAVGVVPPAGWLPAQVRAQLAEQQRQQGGQPQAAPQPPQPEPKPR